MQPKHYLLLGFLSLLLVSWGTPPAEAAPRPIRFAPNREESSSHTRPITNDEMVLRIIPSRSYTETWIMWAWNKEGYAIYAILIVTKILIGTRIGIQFTVRTPDGKVRHKMIEYTPKNLKTHPDRVDVQVERHRIVGDLNRWRLQVDFGETGCDLVFTRKISGLRYQGGPVYFGNLKFVGLTYAPRAEAQGTIRYDGQQIEFQGMAYADRSWQDIMPQQISKRWYGARGLSDQYTIITTHLLTPSAWTPNSVPGVYIAHGDKWIVTTGELRFFTLDHRLDRSSGYDIPMKTVYETTSPNANPRFRLEIQHLDQYDRMDVFSQFNPILRFLLQKFISKPYVYRFRAEMRLTFFKDKKTETQIIPGQAEWAFINP